MIYTVKAGDSLSAIAARYAVQMASIKKVSAIANPNMLSIGENLYIPGKAAGSSLVGTVTVTVKAGDTLGAIAARYNMTLNKLLTFNPAIKDPNRIYVGQKITITGGN